VVSPLPQDIPNQRLTGTQTLPLLTTQAPFTNAAILLARDVNGGLNSLTPADTLTISIGYSLDGGATWDAPATQTLFGGLYVTKGVTQIRDLLAISSRSGDPFPVGTPFRIVTVASVPVRIAATVTYS
jgi:hypothetical protein